MYRRSVIRKFPIVRVLGPIEACRVIWQLAAAGEACVTFKQDRLATHRVRPDSSLERHGAKKEADRCGDKVGIILVRCAKQPAGAIPQVQRNIVCLAARCSIRHCVDDQMGYVRSRTSTGFNFSVKKHSLLVAMIRMRSLLPRILAHVPSVIGFVAFWGICYVLSVLDLTGMQRIFAVSTLVAIYCATAFWYVWTNRIR